MATNPTDPRYAHLYDPAEREWLTNVSPTDVLRNAHRIYDFMSEGGIPVDSYTREMAFEKAADALGIPYDTLYDAWLSGVQAAPLQAGYICKRCGGPSPLGIGYVDHSWAAAQASIGRTACPCGYSAAAEADEDVPGDFPVKVLRTDAERTAATDVVTCGECGRSWDDAVSTQWTPAPSARCPFESFH